MVWVKYKLKIIYNYLAKFTTAFIVYGLSTLFMFISSLLFHLVDFKKSQNPDYYSFQFFKIFHVLERGAIYVCIAGNYHPWLQNIDTEGAIYTSWFTWISAIFGLWFSYTFYERYKVQHIKDRGSASFETKILDVFNVSLFICWLYSRTLSQQLRIEWWISIGYCERAYNQRRRIFLQI